MASDDEILIVQAQRGDREAFARLVSRYEAAMFRFFCRMGADIDLAADLFQEAVLHLYERLDAYDPARRFSPWFYGIAHLVWKDWRRENARRTEQLSRLATIATQWGAAPEAAPDAEVDRDLIGVAVRVAVAQLPEEQRTVLILRHYQGLAYAEIADALGIPLGTVKSRLHNALRALRTELSHKKVLEVG